jgi:hydrogenase maturation protease
VPKVLIIGYGNRLSGDDGVGCRVARMLEDSYCGDPDVRVISAHQLTPEMAEDIANSEFVLFLDAAVGEHAGEIQHFAVTPRPGPLSFAHSLDPGLLLTAADELYGRAPQAESLTMVGACFEVGGELSDVVRQNLAEFAGRVHLIVEPHRVATEAVK